MRRREHACGGCDPGARLGRAAEIAQRAFEMMEVGDLKLEARYDVSGSRVFAAERDGAGSPIFSKTQTLAIASAVAEF